MLPLSPVGESLLAAHHPGIRGNPDRGSRPGRVDDLKWLCAPKGAGFHYVRPGVQALLEPSIVSWDWPADSWADRFRWTGTHDPSAHLAVGAAIDFLAEHDWESVRERCHALAAQAVKDLCELLGTEPFPAHDDEFVQMVSVRLPPCDAEALGVELAHEHRIEVLAQTWQGEPALRVSFQGYNDEEDLEALLRALSRLSSDPRQ